MVRFLVVDACCTLNILATQIEHEIVQACDLRFVMSDRAHGEALFLHSPPDEDGNRVKRSASTERLRSSGYLEIRELDTPALVDAFVECAAQLRDEDASCVALAGVLGLPLMTDDGKERRVARARFPRIELVSTLAVLRGAADALNLSEQDLLRVAANLRWGGNFAPPRKDPLSSWYGDLLRKAGVPGDG